jgi:hypothetical protein
MKVSLLNKRAHQHIILVALNFVTLDQHEFNSFMRIHNYLSEVSSICERLGEQHIHHFAKLEDNSKLKHVATLISSKAKHTFFSRISYSSNMEQSSHV